MLSSYLSRLLHKLLSSHRTQLAINFLRRLLSWVRWRLLNRTCRGGGPFHQAQSSTTTPSTKSISNDGVILASHLPSNATSSSSALESNSTNVPHLAHETQHTGSCPCLSAILASRDHLAGQDQRDRVHDSSPKSLIETSGNLVRSREHLSLQMCDRSCDDLRMDPLRSPSPISHNSLSSHRSRASFGSVNSARRAANHHHAGSVPHTRPSSPYPQISAATTSVSLQPDGLSITTSDPNRQTGGQGSLRISEISSRHVKRYQKRNVQSASQNNYHIPPMQYEYPLFGHMTPVGWTAHRHPEGAVFYMHDESRTLTDADIHNVGTLNNVEQCRKDLWGRLQSQVGRSDPIYSLNLDDVELVVEVDEDNVGPFCSYYFVNSAARALFWLDEWEDASAIFADCEGANTITHKGLAIQCQYWSHWDLFPTSWCKITPELKEEVEAMILHAICDHSTSDQSNAPLSVEELRVFLTLFDRVKSTPTCKLPYSAIIIGRIMKTFYFNYYVNFHGEPCARLNFEESVHGWKYQPSRMMVIFAPLLFFSPVSNVRKLHTIFVDGIAKQGKWNDFIEQLSSQLQDTNLLATVLLNANVGFLAINTVDNGNGTALRQIASYLSLMSSLASIVLGLVFVGYNRTESRNSVSAAAKFLNLLWHQDHGLETLAIIYSLPHAFLLWGVLLFLVATSAEWWHRNTILSGVVIGIGMGFVICLMVWCLWISRDRQHHWWFQADSCHPSITPGDPGGEVSSSSVELQHGQDYVQEMATRPVIAIPLSNRAMLGTPMTGVDADSMPSIPPEIHIR